MCILIFYLVPLPFFSDIRMSAISTSITDVESLNLMMISLPCVQVPFEGILVEAYKDTRRKHNMKFREIGHTTSQYGQSFFPKTISAWNGLAFAEAPSLAVFRSNFIRN